MKLKCYVESNWIVSFNHLLCVRGTLRQLKPYFKHLDTIIERILAGKHIFVLFYLNTYVVLILNHHV